MPDRSAKPALPQPDPPPGEAETYSRLLSRAAGADIRACNGCSRCATRCTDGIEITHTEFAALAEALAGLPEQDVQRVLAQDKHLLIWEDVSVALCPLLDRESERCLVYAARPLICRLFGAAPWLPCPIGHALAPLEGAVALMCEYASLERRTFGEWALRIRSPLTPHGAAVACVLPEPAHAGVGSATGPASVSPPR